MALRETSLEAFQSLRNSGAINELHERILKFIHRTQDLSSGKMVCRHEIEAFFDDSTQSYGPRLVELERRRLLQRVGTKPSPRTGRKVQGWRVVERFDPEAVKGTKPKTSQQRLRQLIADLREFRTAWFFQLGKEGIEAMDTLLERANP